MLLLILKSLIGREECKAIVKLAMTVLGDGEYQLQGMY
jgi:hypothetical protein